MEITSVFSTVQLTINKQRVEHKMTTKLFKH